MYTIQNKKMDDPFSWLQGEKISAKKIQETLQKKNKFIPIIKKDLSLSFMRGAINLCGE